MPAPELNSMINLQAIGKYFQRRRKARALQHLLYLGGWNSPVALVGRRMKFGWAYSTSGRLDSRAARSSVNLCKSGVSRNWRGEPTRAIRATRQYCSSFSVIDWTSALDAGPAPAACANASASGASCLKVTSMVGTDAFS